MRVKPSAPAEQGGRKLLDAGVVFLDGVIEEAAAGGDLVFDVGQLGLQLLEIRVGLEVGVGFRQRDEAAEGAAQLVLRCETPARVLGLS